MTNGFSSLPSRFEEISYQNLWMDTQKIFAKIHKFFSKEDSLDDELKRCYNSFKECVDRAKIHSNAIKPILQNNKLQLADLSRLLVKPSLDSGDKEELKQIAARLNRNFKSISSRNRNDISYAKQRNEADMISKKIRTRVSQTESDIKKIDDNWFHRNPRKTIGIAAGATGALAGATVATSAFLTSSAMFGTTCTLAFASTMAIAGFCSGIGAAIVLVGGYGCVALLCTQ